MQFFSPNLTQKYSPISPIFYRFFYYTVYDVYWRTYFDAKSFKKSIYGSYIFNREIFYYIYLKQSFPDYNPILALYHYRQNFNENLKYFDGIRELISDDKRGYKIEKRLFLIKNEDIPDYLSKKIQFIYKNKKTRDFIINKLLILFMNKYFIDLIMNKVISNL